MSFSPQLKMLAFGCADGHVGRIVLDRDDTLRSEQRHGGEVNVVVFSPDESQIASGSGRWGETGDSSILVWDVNAVRVTHDFTEHRDGVTSLVFTTDGEKLISGSLDNDVRVWDL